jgi:hypothetical protein
MTDTRTGAQLVFELPWHTPISGDHVTYYFLTQELNSSGQVVFNVNYDQTGHPSGLSSCPTLSTDGGTTGPYISSVSFPVEGSSLMSCAPVDARLSSG